jgi:hypothetical protein
MSSERQVDANRLNAQESTGQRTREGKDRPRFNAVTRGMTAKVDALSDQDDDISKLVPVAVAVESSTEAGVPPDHGITQNEPNFLSIDATATVSVARSNHQIPQDEPIFQSIDTTADSRSKRRVLYQDDRRIRAKPRKRHLRGRRGHRRVPLNAARPSRAFGVGRHTPRDRGGQVGRRQWAVSCERPPGWVESRHVPARALGRRGHSGGFISHEIGGWCALADGTEIAAL